MADPIIEFAGEADRIARTVTAFVAQLRDDPRVQRAYRDWREAHGLNRMPVTDRQAIKGAIFRDVDRDLDRVTLFVSDELRLPLLVAERTPNRLRSQV